MPGIKDIARTVILKNWPIGDVAFDALWTTFEHDRVLAIPHGSSNDQSTLAAIGRDTDPAIVAVALFIKVLEELVSDTTLADLLPLLEAISIKLGHKGIAIRLKKTSLAEFEATTTITVPRGYAIAYTREHPNGKRLTEKEARKLWDDRAQYEIAIRHQHDLPHNITGQLFATTRGALEPTDLAPSFPAIHYRLLRHLLKYRERDTERSLPDLIEHCWLDKHTAQELRAPDHDKDTGRYRNLFSRFRATLSEHLNMSFVAEKSSVYGLEPWPRTYCVIDEIAPDEQPLQRG